MGLLLKQTEVAEPEEEVSDVASSEPRDPVEKTKAGMADISSSTVPRMRAKTESALRVRGIFDTGDTVTSTPPVEGGRPKLGLVTSDFNVDELYDPTTQDPMVEALTLPPETTPVLEEAGFGPRDVVNFLFKDTMGVVGAKWDQEGFNWEWENAKQQWSEQPMWLNLLATTDLFGTAIFPLGKAAHLTTKVGRVAEALGTVGSHADELNRWKAMDLLDSGHTKDLNFSQRRAMRIFERNTEKFAAMRSRAAVAEQGGQMGAKDKILYEFERRFSNDYFNKTQSNNAKLAYNERLDKLWKQENIGRFFIDIPDTTAGDAIYQRWMHQMDPNNIPAPSGLTPEQIRWSDSMGQAKIASQQEMLDEGVITQETFDRIGPMHLSAQYKGTPAPDMSVSRQFIVPLEGKKPKQYPGAVTGTTSQRTGLGKLLFGADKPGAVVAGGQDYVALQVYDLPRLNAETLKKRSADLPEVYRRLQAGQLITDPHDLTVRSYVVDRLLLNNFKFVRDMAMDARYGVSHDDIMLKFMKGGTFDVKAAKKAGYVHLEDVGGEANDIMRRMIGKKGGKLGLNGELPWVRRAVFDEVFGSHSGMFAQAQNAANVLDVMSSVFKSVKTAASVPSHLNNLAGNLTMMSMSGMNPFSRRNMTIHQQMAGAFGKMSEVWNAGRAAGVSTREIMEKSTFNLGSVTIDSKTFDLNKELLSPAARELIEENSLDATEGFYHLEELYKRAETGSITRGFIKGALKAKSFFQVGNKAKWFDAMTKAYTAEDMIPKMSMFMHLRSQGFSQTAAAIETGRRLPMYNTVGSTIKGARKWVFPWLTFSTEAARITKNNLMDNPIRMIPWLNMPGILQTMAAGYEGRSPEDVEEGKRSLPFFGQTPTTVMATGQTQSVAGGAATGALVGGIMGALRGGGAGGMAGLGLGAAAGAAFGGITTTKEAGEQLRGAMMDWLPHSSFMLTSTSPDVEWTWKNAIEQIPSSPLAIIKPFYESFSGETAWGQEVGSEGLTDSIGKMFAGMIGNMAPPIIQKYGFKVTTPDVSLSQAITGHHLPGDFTNVSRALIDTGIKIDPLSGKAGSLSQDFVLNNSGMWKSFAASPATRLANEGMAQRNQEAVRTYLAKNLDFYLVNGEDEQSVGILEKIQKSFAKQYVGDPRLAQEKYDDWVKRRIKKIGQHPRLKTWSKEELENRLRTSGSYASETRGMAREEMIKFLQQETRIRNMNGEEAQSVFDQKKKKEGLFNQKSGGGSIF